MEKYILKTEKSIMQGNITEITISVSSQEKLFSPRISAIFYHGDDDRIIPMDLKVENEYFAVAIGKFDISNLFYEKDVTDNINIKFLFSNGSAESVILAPEQELVIQGRKRSRFKHFWRCSKRERQKILLRKVLSFLFLPYRCLPVQQNKVAFLSNRDNKLSGNSKAVFFEMTKSPELEITVLCKKGGIISGLPVLFKFFKIYATSKVVFVDDYYHFITYVKKKDDVKLIQLWHACGAFKTFGFSRLGRDSYLRQNSPNHRQYDYVAVSSAEVIPFYAEGFGIPMKRVVPLGSPRCDVLSDESYKNRFKMQFYTQNPRLKGKRIILFAPTFRGGGLGDCHYPTERFELDRILERISGDYVLLIKMHPYIKARPHYEKEHADRVIDCTDRYDVNDLLFVADLLITDYSSIIFEASVVNVPMLFFAFDLNEYSRDRDFYCNFSSFVPGKVVYNTEGIINAVNSGDYNKELVEPFRKRFFGDTDETATKRVVEFTKGLLK